MKRIDTMSIRDILRHHHDLGLPRAEIAVAVSVSAGTVSNVLERAQAAGLSWPLPSDLDDDGLRAQLYPPAARESGYPAELHHRIRYLEYGFARTFPHLPRGPLPSTTSGAVGKGWESPPPAGGGLSIGSDMGKQSGEVRWERFPSVAGLAEGKQWLEIQSMLGLAHNTVEAYGRGLEDFLRWCGRSRVVARCAGRDDVARYVVDLRQRRGPRGERVVALDSGAGLSNATIQQRLTAVRLFFDFLIEQGVRDINPVGRGRYTPTRGFGAKTARGLVRRYKRLPWIPSDEQWRQFLVHARSEPIRNRFMLALAYDAALRREELCALEAGDIQPAQRLLRVRAETSKSGQDRVVPYSETSGVLLAAYLAHRRTLSRRRGALFLSESRRNYAQPITLWTWSKVVRRIADAAELPRLSTHTLRHLCLSDLARAGWDLHEIARFAGHRNVSVTQQYIHLSGRDLIEKLAGGMAQLHRWRTEQLAKPHPWEGPQ